MRGSIRRLALVYAIVVGAAALWAWYTDVKLLHSAQEHLLPDILLALVTLPSSTLLESLYGRWPAFLQAPLMQLTLLTVCGALQVAALYLLSFLARERRGDA